MLKKGLAWYHMRYIRATLSLSLFHALEAGIIPELS